MATHREDGVPEPAASALRSVANPPTEVMPKRFPDVGVGEITSLLIERLAAVSRPLPPPVSEERRAIWGAARPSR
ncbi:hypothetical protein [Nonomuraea basaltis]|uniref:hypothetical protein n=1 Tax=Nonomuraea basaltis TaxID=2495887 RepID=UPI00110C4C8C|nr:hypothetical protein [Nonomuraea basaltis]TMR95105.1 hypothetical protein EJK15_30310 [Nonomuraea basaltis]